MICTGCNRIMREQQMVRINWCVDCATEAQERLDDEKALREAWRCRYCRKTVPDHERTLNEPEPGTYVCVSCRAPGHFASKNSARDLEYPVSEDHADSKVHNDWLERERRLQDL